MRVHATAVVAKERLGHETGRFAVLPCHVLDDVFVDHHRVSGTNEGIKPVINFRLTGSCHFVMLPFDGYAEFLHDQAHFSADVLLRIRRRDRKISFLVPNLVAKIGHFIAAGVPDGFFGFNRIKCAIAPAVELHIVKNEKFRFGPEEGLIGYSSAREIFLGR